MLVVNAQFPQLLNHEKSVFCVCPAGSSSDFYLSCNTCQGFSLHVIRITWTCNICQAIKRRAQKRCGGRYKSQRQNDFALLSTTRQVLSCSNYPIRCGCMVLPCAYDQEGPSLETRSTITVWYLSWLPHCSRRAVEWGIPYR